MAQVFNPYLPLWEHIPDGEPHKFDGRIYIYGSHDKPDGKAYCEDHYTVWSAPENDLSDWMCHGTAYMRSQDPSNADDNMQLWAPDVTRGPDGRYYMYYCFNFYMQIGVAVADSPAGPFEFYGHVKYPDGTDWTAPLPFDPAVLTDDDGRVYLYSGFTPGGEKPMNIPQVSKEELEKMPDLGKTLENLARIKFVEYSSVAELEPDMVTLKETPRDLIPCEKVSQGTSFEGHGFFEASSIRKFNGKYYFVYSSHKSHELCYAISDYPDRDFVFGGTLVSNGDLGLPKVKKPVNIIGNNHGGIVEAGGEYYIFYHRQTNGSEYSRQGCAERLTMRKDGGFDQVEITSCGLNGAPLTASGNYPAAIACHVRSANSLDHIDYDDPKMKNQTHITQDHNEIYITNVEDETVIGYKYFVFSGADMMTAEFRGSFDGSVTVSTDRRGRKVIGEAYVHIQSDEWNCQMIPLDEVRAKQAVYFHFKGNGNMDFKGFSFVMM